MSQIPWFRVDDTLASHPKARAAGLRAMGLWVVAGAYASQYLTGGFVPDWYVASWPQGRRSAADLVAVGLWGVADGGWTFHQWGDRQPTKDQVEQDRKTTRERQREWRDKKRNAVTPAVSNAVTNGAPTQPYPTQVTTEELNLGGNRPETLQPADARCTTHQGHADPGPCRGCMAARERAEADAEGAKHAARTVRAGCGVCGGSGWVETTDGLPAGKCDHQRRTA